jgi:hypothetical protein
LSKPIAFLTKIFTHHFLTRTGLDKNSNNLDVTLIKDTNLDSSFESKKQTQDSLYDQKSQNLIDKGITVTSFDKVESTSEVYTNNGNYRYSSDSSGDKVFGNITEGENKFQHTMYPDREKRQNNIGYGFEDRNSVGNNFSNADFMNSISHKVATQKSETMLKDSAISTGLYNSHVSGGLSRGLDTGIHSFSGNNAYISLSDPVKDSDELPILNLSPQDEMRDNVRVSMDVVESLNDSTIDETFSDCSNVSNKQDENLQMIQHQDIQDSASKRERKYFPTNFEGFTQGIESSEFRSNEYGSNGINCYATNDQKSFTTSDASHVNSLQSSFTNKNPVPNPSGNFLAPDKRSNEKVFNANGDMVEMRFDKTSPESQINTCYAPTGKLTTFNQFAEETRCRDDPVETGKFYMDDVGSTVLAFDEDCTKGKSLISLNNNPMSSKVSR